MVRGKECVVWSLRCPSGWVIGLWERTVERGKKKGWYVVKIIGNLDGRHRSKPTQVHPDRVRVGPWTTEQAEVDGQEAFRLGLSWKEYQARKKEGEK